MTTFQKIDDRFAACSLCGQRIIHTINGKPIDLEKVHHRCINDPPAMPDEGPGTELRKLLAELGGPIGCGPCNSLAAKMNQWGAEGCREHRQEIIEQLKANWRELPTRDKLRAAIAGMAAVATGAASVSDPIGSLVDEAIRRSESCTQPPSS